MMLKTVLKSRAFALSPTYTGTFKEGKRLDQPLVGGSQRANKNQVSPRVCMCAPTSHAGSFRCRLHRSSQSSSSAPPVQATRKPLSAKQSRFSRVVPLASMAEQEMGMDRVENKETPDEGGPMRFLRYAAGAGAAAIAVGAGVQAWKQAKGGSHEERVAALGSGAPPAAAAKGLGEDGGQAYEVVKGDTLGRIASRLGTTPEVIREVNGFQGDDVYPGQKLWVPKTHTIQKGETLSTIAKHHNTSLQDLLRINTIANPDVIYPGDILLLP
eukprot:jgi/Mesen1/8965/ME000056S08373